MSNSTGNNKTLLCIKSTSKLGVQICDMLKTVRCWNMSIQTAVLTDSVSFHSYDLKQSYNHIQSFIFKNIS
jgi:hypothetical protein